MKREFLINIFFLILINVLIKPFYILFIETRVQDTLGPNVFGLYFGIFNIAFILQILSDLGIQNYNSRTIARKPELLKKYLPKILGTKILLSFLYLLVGILVAAIFGYLSSSLTIFLMISVNLILLSFILYLRTNIAATGRYRLDSIISVIDKVLLIFILSYLLFIKDIADFSIFSFIYAQSIAYFMVLVLVLFINSRLAGISKVSFDFAFTKNLLKKSLPFSFVIILMSLYMRMDGFMLEQMLGDNAYQAGVYAAAFRIYEAFNMIGYLFAILLLPMFASLLNKRDELLILIKSSHNLILTIATLALAGTYIYSQEIMLFLYPKHADAYYGELLGFLMLSYFAISISYIYSTFLTSSSMLKQLNKLLIAGVIINLILNLILIPEWGAKGAAIVTVGTQFFVLIGNYYLSVKQLAIKQDIGLLVKRSLFIFLVFVIALSYQSLNIFDNWFLNLSLLELIFLLLAFVFGLISVKDLRKPSIN